jgi:hypothetical protein
MIVTKIDNININGSCIILYNKYMTIDDYLQIAKLYRSDDIYKFVDLCLNHGFRIFDSDSYKD